MKSNAEERDVVRLYLLGLLPAAEQQPLEERLFTDDAFYEEILIAEDELIDQYLAGRVAPSERERFEEHFLTTPERWQKLRFARALRRRVAGVGPVGVEPAAEPAEPSREAVRPRPRDSIFRSFWRRPALAFSLAAAVLLVVSGASWLAVRGLRPRSGPVVTVLLTPGGLTRDGGGVQQLTVPAGTGDVQLRLGLAADDFPSYRATLLDAEGATVSGGDGLKPEQVEGGKVVVLSVPARDLPPGDYQLRLAGLRPGGDSESAGSYRFRVKAP